MNAINTINSVQIDIIEEAIETKNFNTSRFSKITTDCLNKVKDLFLAIANKVYQFILSFIWPLPNSTNQKGVPTLEKHLQNAADAYFGKPINSEKKHKIIQMPKALKKKITIIPASTLIPIKKFERCIVPVSTFALIKDLNLSPELSFSVMNLQRRISNNLTNLAGAKNTREFEIKQNRHERVCLTICEISSVIVYLSVQDPTRASVISNIGKFTLLMASNFPEIQDYLVKVPLIQTSINTIENCQHFATTQIGNRIFRPVIKKYLMPVLTQKLIELSKSKNLKWLTDTLKTHLQNEIRKKTANVKEIQNKINHAPKNSNLSFEIEKLELAKEQLNDSDKNLKMLNSFNEICEETDNYLNQNNSILASISNTLINKHCSEPFEKLVANGFKHTEDFITKTSAQLFIFKIKNVAWSYFISQKSPQATTSTNLRQLVAITNPLFNATIMIVSGGREQTVSELAIRMIGVVVMLQSGSLLLGNLFIYSSFFLEYMIDLRKIHLERNNIEDPIYMALENGINYLKTMNIHPQNCLDFNITSENCKSVPYEVDNHPQNAIIPHVSIFDRMIKPVHRYQKATDIDYQKFQNNKIKFDNSSNRISTHMQPFKPRIFNRPISNLRAPK